MISMNHFLSVISPFFGLINKTLTTAGCFLTAGFLTAVLLLVQLVRRYRKQVMKSALRDDHAFHDVSAMAGEDVVMAQLDLARAFLGMGKRDEAKSLLEKIRKQGTQTQREDARRLMEEIQ